MPDKANSALCSIFARGQVLAWISRAGPKRDAAARYHPQSMLWRNCMPSTGGLSCPRPHTRLLRGQEEVTFIFQVSASHCILILLLLFLLFQVRVSLSLFSAFPVLLVSPPTLSDPPSAFAFLAFVCRILLPCTGSLSLTCLLSLVSLLVSSPSALFSRYLVHLSPRALLPGELPDQTPPPTLPLCPAHL